MKLFIMLLSVVAIALIGYNITEVSLNEPFNGESLTALITILASLCALVMLQILLVSKKIEGKLKTNK